MAKTTAAPAEENKVIAARNKNLDMVLQTIVKENGDGATTRISDMIEGTPALDELDLIGQARMTDCTSPFFAVTAADESDFTLVA